MRFEEAQQRSAGPFDQIERTVRLVRAVDGEVERREAVEIGERNGKRARLLGRAFGSRGAHDFHAAAQLGRQHVEKRFGRRTGAEAELHAVFDEFERAQRRGALETCGIRRVGHGENVRTVKANPHRA
jgi:hypothetical protein